MRDVYNLFEDFELFEGFEDQGWNDETMAILLAGFLLNHGHAASFRQYLQEIADEENADARNLLDNDDL